MIRAYDTNYKVDGSALLAPDEGAEDYAYLMGLFSGKVTFTFSFPENDATKTCTAYCSKASVVLHSSRTGLYKNLKFNIIEC